MTAFDISTALDGDRLDRAVYRLLGADGFELGRADAKRLVEQGRVRLDGRVERRGSTRVRAGQSVAIDVDTRALADRREARAAQVELDAAAALYREAGVVAVNKPAGLPSHATRDPRRDHLEAAVGRLLDRLDGASGRTARVVHRLDRDTTGVVLLAEDSAVHGPLTEAFRGRDVHKTYVAVCHDGGLPDSGTCNGRLDTRRDGTVVVVPRGGRSARTHWQVLERVGGLAVVEARPETGRKHQIRAHLAHLGAPIVHDPRYGGAPASGSTRYQLHALRLVASVPEIALALDVQAPWPTDFVRPAPDGFGTD